MSIVNKRRALALTAAHLALIASGSAVAQEVEQCQRKLGVMAVIEPPQGWNHLSSYGLGSPASLLRLMIQKSGCFDVVERGQAMQTLQQERALAGSGEMRQDSNIGKGQMQAADFVMTPDVQVRANDTGGLGGMLAGKLGIVGSLVGGMKFKEASTSLLVADVRSSIQVAAAEGKASKTDFNLGALGWAGDAVAGANGYTKTPEGKMIAASFLDNYNNIVRQVRDQGSLVRTGSAAGETNAAASTQAGAAPPAGAVLRPKIANVKLYAEPSRSAKVVATLQRSDDLVANGQLKDGFAYVDAADFSGWVQRTLLSP